jgi:hypothetical protein
LGTGQNASCQIRNCSNCDKAKGNDKQLERKPLANQSPDSYEDEQATPKSEWHALPMIDEWIPIHCSEHGPCVFQLEHWQPRKITPTGGYLFEKTCELKRCKWTCAGHSKIARRRPGADKLFRDDRE